MASKEGLLECVSFKTRGAYRVVCLNDRELSAISLEGFIAAGDRFRENVRFNTDSRIALLENGQKDAFSRSPRSFRERVRLRLRVAVSSLVFPFKIVEHAHWHEDPKPYIRECFDRPQTVG